jgi:hypothetical protein
MEPRAGVYGYMTDRYAGVRNKSEMVESVLRSASEEGARGVNIAMTVTPDRRVDVSLWAVQIAAPRPRSRQARLGRRPPRQTVAARFDARAVS